MKYLVSIFTLFILSRCSNDSGTQPIADVAAPSVAGILVEDISDNGNGTDLEISFDKVADESLISGYRVFVVRKTDEASFDLAMAESISSDNYFDLEADGTNKAFTLNENSNDSEGNLIIESIEYVVFVLSIADGSNAQINSLSFSSPAITLAHEIITAPSVIGIKMDDIHNNANGSDLKITFNRASDEALISEYRVLVVKSSSKSSFDLSAAESVDASNYLTVPKDGSDKSIVLDASSNDVDGHPITEYIQYAVFVLSVADGTIATVNSLKSSPSDITLAKIKITYIGNDGVYITDGEKGVIIDALPSTTQGWRPLSNGLQSNVERGNEPFDNISVAMITHNHGDHFSTSSMNSFLSNNSTSVLLAPTQIRGGFSGGAQQIIDFTLSLDSETDMVLDGIPIRIMSIRHFTPQDGTDFSSSESYAYLIELGGKKILHIGDGDLSAVNFADMGLETEGIDVVLIPTFTFSGQLTATNRDILLNEVGPENIIGLHLASGTSVSTVTNIYPDATVFTTSLQFVQY